MNTQEGFCVRYYAGAKAQEINLTTKARVTKVQLNVELKKLKEASYDEV